MSPPLPPDEYRANLYARQRVINTKFLDDKALNGCTRWLQYGTLTILVKQKGEKIGYGNLQTCKKRWICPICADRMARATRAALARAIQAEAACGYTPLFITYTARHNQENSLSESRAMVARSHRRLHSGREFSLQAASCGYDGSFRASEITYGASGWHFHLHELVFVRNRLAAANFVEFLRDGWSAAVATEGGYAKKGVGLVAESATASIALYVSKFGIAAELTQGAQKLKDNGHYLPFQFADLALRDSRRTRWAADKFAEYAAATKGLKQTATGGALRPLFRHIKDNPDVPDYETNILASLTVDEWRRVVGKDARAELLSAIERKDLATASAIVGRQFDNKSANV